ncbi:MAG: four helix bundle protein [Verrucomicrobia bacterium]|nr:four helix bundle protein [Verrucomicrobiota bacterium]
MRDYRKIVAWQRGHALALRIYRITQEFPRNEQFGITSQLRRAASSVPANIVEGSARDTQPDYLRFLIVARASLKEVEYFLLLARDLGYMPTPEYDETGQEINKAFAAISGLIKAVRSQIDSP